MGTVRSQICWNITQVRKGDSHGRFPNGSENGTEEAEKVEAEKKRKREAEKEAEAEKVSGTFVSDMAVNSRPQEQTLKRFLTPFPLR